MKITYTQKELKEEYIRRHAKDLETIPIYCVDGKYVSQKPSKWYDAWWVVVSTIVAWSVIFYFGYDLGQGVHCG